MADASQVKWVPARRVKQRYGDKDPISDMTLWRWINDPRMGFPQPTYFGRFRFWREDELDEYDRTRPRGRTLADAVTEAA